MSIRHTIKIDHFILSMRYCNSQGTAVWRRYVWDSRRVERACWSCCKDGSPESRRLGSPVSRDLQGWITIEFCIGCCRSLVGSVSRVRGSFPCHGGNLGSSTPSDNTDDHKLIDCIVINLSHCCTLNALNIYLFCMS